MLPLDTPCLHPVFSGWKDASRRLPRGLYQHKGGSYYARDQRNGKDLCINLGRDLALARKKLREWRQSGRPQESQATVRALVEQWLRTRIAVGRTPKGQRQARGFAERFLVPFLGAYRVSKITPEVLRGYRIYVESHTRSTSTARHILVDARSFLLWCVDAGFLASSPWPRGLFPRLQEKAPKGFTDEERAALMALPEPHGFVLRLALCTGLRWGELCRLQSHHVRDGVLVVEQTKSRRVRRVPLTASLAAELSSRPSPLVPYAESSAGSFNKVVGRLAGVPGFHVHHCRHDYGIRWLVNGGSLAALQSILGHADISTTMMYAKVNADMVQREAERVLETWI